MSGAGEITLRVEAPEDAPAIREVHRLAFAGNDEAAIVDAVRLADAVVLSMVAVENGAAAACGAAVGFAEAAPAAGGDLNKGCGAPDDGDLVAHVLYTRVTVTPEDGPDGEAVSLLGLAPVGVLPSRQGQGIGTMLIEASLERLRAACWPAVVVVGDPHYYPRFGFVPAGRFGLRWEGGAPDEAFMALELSPGALAGIRGVVRFRSEFDGV
jgi:putative acetyltransferase